MASVGEGLEAPVAAPISRKEMFSELGIVPRAIAELQADLAALSPDIVSTPGETDV